MGFSMMNFRLAKHAAILGAIGVALSACAIQRAHEAARAKTELVGMSKESVLACMGPPQNREAEGTTEVWSYASGNNETDTFGSASAFGNWNSAFALGSSSSSTRSCTVNIVMSSGMVSRVNYSGPTGGLLTEGEQCAFAINNCVSH